MKLREGVVKKRESPDFRSPEVGDVIYLEIRLYFRKRECMEAAN